MSFPIPKIPIPCPPVLAVLELLHSKHTWEFTQLEVPKIQGTKL